MFSCCNLFGILVGIGLGRGEEEANVCMQCGLQHNTMGT